MTPKRLLLQKSGINRNFPMPLFYCSIKIWAVHWSFGELFCGIFPIRPNLRTEQQCDLERISLSFSSCYPECQHGHRQRCDSERISCAIFHRSRFEIPETKNYSVAIFCGTRYQDSIGQTSHHVAKRLFLIISSNFRCIKMRSMPFNL